MIREEAAQLIRTAREDIGMTQAQLAAAARIHQPTLAAYESGRRVPRTDTLRKILSAAKMRPSVPLELFADRINTLARTHGLSNVRVFGSAVHGTDTENSDIDLLVTAPSGTSLINLSAFALDVEDLTGFSTDVATDDLLQQHPFAHVAEEAVPL